MSSKALESTNANHFKFINIFKRRLRYWHKWHFVKSPQWYCVNQTVKEWDKKKVPEVNRFKSRQWKRCLFYETLWNYCRHFSEASYVLDCVIKCCFSLLHYLSCATFDYLIKPTTFCYGTSNLSFIVYIYLSILLFFCPFTGGPSTGGNVLKCLVSVIYLNFVQQEGIKLIKSGSKV